MTQELEIVRWDPVSFNNIIKNPMIYVKPTETFLTAARDSKFLLRCMVTGSGSMYDNVDVIGVVRQSSIMPNCRPNFFQTTGLYTITLLGPWGGYPPNMGHVKIL